MFYDILKLYDWNEVADKINSISSHQVEKAIRKNKKDIYDFMALVSPASNEYLNPILQESQQLTQKRFGKAIQLFVPLYLSNECKNICVYCGFSMNNKIPRKTLSVQEIQEEVKTLVDMGFQHILLLTGEDAKDVGVDYLQKAIETIKPFVASISLEVQPLEKDEYARLQKEHLNAVYVYQETYREQTYRNYHTKGKKSLFKYRLDTPDRLGMADIHKIGLGILLGLENWRVEAFFLALHLQYLRKKYWKCKFSISFPRIKKHKGSFDPNIEIDDRNLLQLIGAFRLFDNDIEIALSTRETPKLREIIMPLGITHMSAASKTNPGGYSQKEGSLEQFSVSDERSAKDISNMILANGYEPLWKDWDPSLQ